MTLFKLLMMCMCIRFCTERTIWLFCAKQNHLSTPVRVLPSPLFLFVAHFVRCICQSTTMYFHLPYRSFCSVFAFNTLIIIGTRGINISIQFKNVYFVLHTHSLTHSLTFFHSFHIHVQYGCVCAIFSLCTRAIYAAFPKRT